MRRLHAIRRDEGGWAVVTAIVLMAIMLAGGMATLLLTDTQTRMSDVERRRESSFNLAESVLSAQAFQLARRWPMSADRAFAACTAASTATYCPDEGRLGAAFTSPDYADGLTFTTQIFDNGDGGFFDPATTTAQPSWDANADGRMWVRAQATARGKTRAIVAQVRSYRESVGFPERAILAGRIGTTNNGNKPIIDTRGNAQRAVKISVRCTQTNPAGASPGCVDIEREKGQIAPDTLEPTPYPFERAIDPSVVALLRQQAQVDDTLFEAAEGCPASLAGAVVFIDGPADCAYTSNSVFNSPAQPGILVVANGTLSLGGTVQFHGIVYVLNPTNRTDYLVNLNGTALIDGAVFVDGGGGLFAGSSKLNVSYNRNVFGRLSVTGDGTIVRNTWRELPITGT